MIIPMRALDRAKSRLRPATTNPQDHRDLVTAMRRDSVSAVAACAATVRVVIVAERPDEVESSLATAAAFAHVMVIADPPGSGLNNALRHGADWAAARWPGDPVAAVVADLPALTPAHLDQVLQAAAAHDRSFVVDRHHVGTTVLTAHHGSTLAPMFGPQSAARHAASGAVSVAAALSVRADVDVLEDLEIVAELGVGPATLETLGAGATRCGDTA